MPPDWHVAALGRHTWFAVASSVPEAGRKFGAGGGNTPKRLVSRFTHNRPAPSELQPYPAPGANRRAGRIKRRMHQGKLAVHGGKRAGDECTLIRETCWSKLSPGIVPMIQQVVDLSEEQDFRMNLVSCPQVHQSVPG
jgi:hypothetical protein